MDDPLRSVAWLALTVMAGLWLQGQALGDAITWHGSGKSGAVAAGGSGAVAAGMQILGEGGNAADAAVATILALAVTDYGSFAIGGGGAAHHL